MRYLFVTVDSAGALYPQLALAQRMRGRGHDVRFLSCRSQRDAIEMAGFRVSVYRGVPDLDMNDRGGPVRDWLDGPETAFHACCEHIWFGPAEPLARDVLAEVAREPVDALAIDYFAFGAAVAAERSSLPAAILWHTSFGEWPAFDLGLPALNAARRAVGLAEDASVYDAYRRAARILVLTTERFGLALEPQALPANVRHVGPQLRPGEVPALKSAVHRARSVLVSLSTSYQAQEDLLRRALDAIAQLPVTALVTTGPAVTLDGEAPANVEVKRWVAHSDVLPGTDLVVTHAGLGTVMTAMAYGVPLLCLPMGRDQHGNAARAQRLGFATSIDQSASTDALRSAIGAALDDDRLRARARELAQECAATGFDAGALELEAGLSRL